MDFHIITTSSRVHLFSADNGRIIDAPSDTMGAHTVEPTHDIQIPLTKEVLQEIEEKSPDPDVRVLLREVARLRAVVICADKLQRMLTTLPGPQGSILNTLREKLKDEPYVEESPCVLEGELG